MKNKISDLNDHLFAQLERLGNEDLKGEDLKNEIDRGKAITGVADKVISNANLALEAHRLQLDYGDKDSAMPVMLENKP